MSTTVFLTAFAFSIIAFGFLGYLVFKFKQNLKPLFYILAIFITANIFHFQFAAKSESAALIWLVAINLEAFAVYIFALLGWRKLKAASK
ncbi:MAG: hypothetical protein ACI857_000410 [Arenicella sp.]